MGQPTPSLSEIQKRRTYGYTQDPTQPSNSNREALLERTLPPEVVRPLHIVHRAPGTHPSLAHFPIDAEQGEDAHGESKPGHPHENSGGVTSQQSRLPLLSTTDQSHLAGENKFNCGSRRSHEWSLHNRRIAKGSSDNQKNRVYPDLSALPTLPCATCQTT